MANPNIPPGPGRPLGIPNKATMAAREAIAAFVDANAERLNALLDRIQEKDPKAAFDCIMSVCEYHIPKLARKEHVGDPNQPIEHRVVHNADEDIIKRYLTQKPEEK